MIEFRNLDPLKERKSSRERTNEDEIYIFYYS